MSNRVVIIATVLLLSIFPLFAAGSADDGSAASEPVTVISHPVHETVIRGGEGEDAEHIRVRNVSSKGERMNRESVVHRIEAERIIAIIRTHSTDNAIEAAKILFENGIKVVEIAYSTPNAPKALDVASAYVPKDGVLGAGTVLEARQAEEAIDHGACLLVTPTVCERVIEVCRRRDVASVCGAFSPTEAQTAYAAGADFVKIFPASVIGPTFFKAMGGPLGHIRLVAVGGVTALNMPDYLRAGATAVGLGSSLISDTMLEPENRHYFQSTAAEVTKLARSANGSVKQVTEA